MADRTTRYCPIPNAGTLRRRWEKSLDRALSVGGIKFSHTNSRPRRARLRKKISTNKARYFFEREAIISDSNAAQLCLGQVLSGSAFCTCGKCFGPLLYDFAPEQPA